MKNIVINGVDNKWSVGIHYQTPVFARLKTGLFVRIKHSRYGMKCSGVRCVRRRAERVLPRPGSVVISLCLHFLLYKVI